MIIEWEEATFDDVGILSKYGPVSQRDIHSISLHQKVAPSEVYIKIKDVYNNVVYLKKRSISSQEIYRMINNGEDVNLENCYITDFDFKECKENVKKFNAFGCVWAGDIKFDNAVFTGNVSFESSIFMADVVSFRGTTFKNEITSFANAIFYSNSIQFRKSKFECEVTSFNNASFINTFDSNRFKKNSSKAKRGIALTFNNVSFEECKFTSIIVNFRRTYFGVENVSFSNVKISNNTRKFDFSYAKVEKCNMYFNLIECSAAIIFTNSDIVNSILTISSSRFLGGVYASYILIDASEFRVHNSSFENGRMYFAFAKFYDERISFKDVVATEISFLNVTFNNDVDFYIKSADTVIIKNCQIKSVFNMRLLKCERLSFDQTFVVNKLIVDYDENDIKKALISYDDYLCNMSEDEKKEQGHYEPLYKQFRMLKENFKNLGNYDEEDAAFVSYMDYYQKDQKKKLGCKRFLSISYLFKKITKYIGDYGTNPAKVLCFSTVIVFLFTILYFFIIDFENTYSCIDKIVESFYFSGITYVTIGYGDISPVDFKDSPNGLFYIFTVFQGFLGVFLNSYLLIAIVRKTLR